MTMDNNLYHMSQDECDYIKKITSERVYLSWLACAEVYLYCKRDKKETERLLKMMETYGLSLGELLV